MKRFLASALIVSAAGIAAHTSGKPAASPFANTPPPDAEEGKVTALREDIEWTRIRLPHMNGSKAPYVLLVGDSITEGYRDGVAKALSGKARVGSCTTSLCVADPAFEPLLRMLLAHGKFAVIHFNNGLHGVGYTEAQYKAGYANAIRLIRESQPDARIVVALTTPLKPGSGKAFLNPRMVKRNEIAGAIAEGAGLRLDDLHKPMENHPEYYADPYHYKANAIAIQSQAVAAAVEAALAR